MAGMATGMAGMATYYFMVRYTLTTTRKAGGCEECSVAVAMLWLWNSSNRAEAWPVKIILLYFLFFVLFFVVLLHKNVKHNGTH